MSWKAPDSLPGVSCMWTYSVSHEPWPFTVPYVQHQTLINQVCQQKLHKQHVILYHLPGWKQSHLHPRQRIQSCLLDFTVHTQTLQILGHFILSGCVHLFMAMRDYINKQKRTLATAPHNNTANNTKWLGKRRLKNKSNDHWHLSSHLHFKTLFVSASQSTL